MASIYEGKCDACGETTGMAPDGYLACRLDTGEYTPLSHPGESEALKRLGFTFDEARDQGRLLSFEYVACDNCGTPDYRPIVAGRGTAGGLLTSCLTYPAIWIICLWICEQIHAISLPLRVAAGICTAIAVSVIVGAAREREFLLAETSRRETEICRQCGGDLFSRIRTETAHICPTCKKKTMRYQMTGRS